MERISSSNILSLIDSINGVLNIKEKKQKKIPKR